MTPLLDNIDISHGIYEYVSGDSPLAFSIMPVHHVTLSDQISTLLGRVVPPLPSPGSLKTGQLVCCLCGDLKWRRGVVRGVFAEDEVSNQPIRTRYLGHETGYQPFKDQYFLVFTHLITVRVYHQHY